MIEADKLQLKKGDYLILIIILIIFVVLCWMISGSRQGNKVHVTANGITTTYSLDEKQRITISDSGDEDIADTDIVIKNTIVIDEGQVFMENADCPDQLCVNHRPISKNGEMIICLPNEVLIEVENDIDNEIDN